jgi:hypothetical protein
VAVEFSSIPSIENFDTTVRPLADGRRKHQQLQAVSICGSRMPMKPMRFDTVLLWVAGW